MIKGPESSRPERFAQKMINVPKEINLHCLGPGGQKGSVRQLEIKCLKKFNKSEICITLAQTCQEIQDGMLLLFSV